MSELTLRDLETKGQAAIDLAHQCDIRDTLDTWAEVGEHFGVIADAQLRDAGHRAADESDREAAFARITGALSVVNNIRDALVAALVNSCSCKNTRRRGQ